MLELSPENYTLRTYAEAVLESFLMPRTGNCYWRLPTKDEYDDHDLFSSHWYQDDAEKDTNSIYFARYVRVDNDTHED